MKLSRCTSHIYGYCIAIIVVLSLFLVSVICTILLKFCKSQCCGIPLTEEKHFDINELNVREDHNEKEPGQQMKVLRSNSILQRQFSMPEDFI